MKGRVRIGGAVVLGALAILGAFYLRNNNAENAVAGEIVVTSAPERNYIPTTDTDGDGIKDWEESLQARIFEAIDSPSTTSSSTEGGAYTPPTTFTGKFSEAFLKDYMTDKAATGDPEAQISNEAKLEIVNNALTAIEKNTQSKLHSAETLTIIPATHESVKTYGNQVVLALRGPDGEIENEALILQKALAANDPKMLEALSVHQAGYTEMIAKMLLVPVPEPLATTHVELLNALEAILTDIEAMQVGFTDPLYTLARLNRYEDDANNFLLALRKIIPFFTKYNVMYTKDDPAAFFSIIGI